MVPDPSWIKPPLRDGLRELRSTIRAEARSGALSRRIFGAPQPTREVARIADDVFSRATATAWRVLGREGSPPIETDLDRLGRIAVAGRRPPPAEVEAAASALRRVLLAALATLGEGETAVSEMRLAAALERVPLRSGDPARSLASLSAALAAAKAVRRAGPGGDVAALAATAAGLAVFVRLRSGEPGAAVVEAAARVAEAEGERWLPLVRTRAVPALAAEWERVAPYLP